MDRLTRKELKSDKFALEVEHTVDFVTDHRAQVVRYGAIALAVIVLAVAWHFYSSYRHDARQEALRAASRILDANVGPPPTPANPSMLNYPTEEARQKALVKEFTDLAANYSGSEEAATALYYLATNAADKGDTAGSEKYFKQVIDSGYANYASMAKLALAHLYASQGKVADGEKLIRSVIDKPTDFVSKEDATISLARLLAHTRPDEARKLLEPLRTARSAVSRAALSALSDMSQSK